MGERANTEDGRRSVLAMSAALAHRGPDDQGCATEPDFCGAHRRLSILDPSNEGHQPMVRGPLTLLYNGEVYNYLELRAELERLGREFTSDSDTEVVLAAYQEWGVDCLHRFLGMFAFAIWDRRDRSLFLARDRFGVKPLYVASLEQENGLGLAFASEIRALQAAGIGCEPDPASWARFLVDGAPERGRQTFWLGVERLAAGELAVWQDGRLCRSHWYDIGQQVGGEGGMDDRSQQEVVAELAELLEESVRLRFRSDVPVGINLSGGLDSSLLLALVARTQGAERERICAFTFVTGDANYDELPWVEAMLEGTPHPRHAVRLREEEVPALAESVAAAQSEPAGGLATLAYAKLFEQASQGGVKVLLDGQGMDEAWAGYDYYQNSANAEEMGGQRRAPLQGSTSQPTRPAALDPAFAAQASTEPPFGSKESTHSPLIARQLFDLQQGKLPRALRYNDRVSMRSSVELREPFLDHRLVELGLRQPLEHKIRAGQGKALPRQLAARWMPTKVRLAPKRPMQTPQREWLRGPLREWAKEQIDRAVGTGWLQAEVVEREWQEFADGRGDNAFFVWQWIDLGLLVGSKGCS